MLWSIRDALMEQLSVQAQIKRMEQVFAGLTQLTENVNFLKDQYGGEKIAS